MKVVFVTVFSVVLSKVLKWLSERCGSVRIAAGSAAGGVFLLSFFCLPSYGWDHHRYITWWALQGWDKGEQASFEPLELVLPVLQWDGKTFANREEFFRALQIHGEKGQWDDPLVSSASGPTEGGDGGQAGFQGSKGGAPWDVNRAEDRSLWLMARASEIPDGGMDQDLDLSEDQRFLGGTTGPASQAFRHYFLVPFDFRMPLATFHWPKPWASLGMAPWRGQMFFDLAIQAKRAKHLYWGYRFLGMAMHYMQDLTQPLHSHQFGSVVLLPWGLLMRGVDTFVKESTRLVTNYHLGYEAYVEYLLMKSAPGVGGGNSLPDDLDDVLVVPQASPVLKEAVEQRLEGSVVDTAMMVSKASAMLAPRVVGSLKGMMADDLEKPGVALNFASAAALPWGQIDKPTKDSLKTRREHLMLVTKEALSNAGMMTRWMFDRFRQGK